MESVIVISYWILTVCRNCAVAITESSQSHKVYPIITLVFLWKMLSANLSEGIQLEHACCVTKSCLTIYDPMDCSPPGSSVHEIFQARILEQVAISSSGGLPNPGIQPMSPASPALAGGFFTTEPPGKHLYNYILESNVCLGDVYRNILQQMIW